MWPIASSPPADVIRRHGEPDALYLVGPQTWQKAAGDQIGYLIRRFRPTLNVVESEAVFVRFDGNELVTVVDLASPSA